MAETAAVDLKPDSSTHWWAIIVVIFAAIHLFCPPAGVAELEVVPDSVEYAVAAHRFATTGQYEIRVNGRALPPRYPPGFSVLFLAPIYAMAPGNIGNGIFIVWVAGVLAALFAYLIGARLAGPWGGVLSAVFLLHHPQFADYTQVILTDVPAVALGLAAGWLYLAMGRQKETSTRAYLLAGVVVALAMSIRPLTGLLALPFLLTIFKRRKRTLANLLALALPGAIVVAGTAWYQWHAFGDWRRTGYQFWLAVPYDYPWLTFSTRYFKDNLSMFGYNLFWLPIVLGVFGAIALLSKHRAQVTPVLTFLMLTGVPLSAIHLFYFFGDIRFHFLAVAFLLILAGAGLATYIPRAFQQKAWPVLAAGAMTILFPQLASNPLSENKPLRYHVAGVCARMLPANAILISGIDPDYLEQMVARGTARHILPIDRQTPYASALLAWKRVPNPKPSPRNAADHACPGLENGGAERLYPATADEAEDALRTYAGNGVPVFLEMASRKPTDPAVMTLRQAFRLTPVSIMEPWLYRLELPESPGGTFARVH